MEDIRLAGRCGRKALYRKAKLVFVSIRTNQHAADWSARFCRAVSQIPEVVEFYRMSGDIDYVFRVVVPDMAAYDRVYKRLIEAVEVDDVSSNFAMECIKQTTALPLEYASG